MSQNKKGQEISSCTKNGVFFSAASCNKDTVFGAARKFFGPSYFVTALESFLNQNDARFLGTAKFSVILHLFHTKVGSGVQIATGEGQIFVLFLHFLILDTKLNIAM